MNPGASRQAIGRAPSPPRAGRAAESRRATRPRQCGFTLIELVTSIVIIAIATSSILLALNSAIGRSADPMVEEQASAIAQAYLEEILLKSFCDPDFSTSCPTACTTSACGRCAGAFGPAETRSTFDDVCDYGGLNDTGAHDQNGNLITALRGYNVSVRVLDSGVSLNGLAASAGRSVLVNVTVSHPALNGGSVTLSGFKANY